MNYQPHEVEVEERPDIMEPSPITRPFEPDVTPEPDHNPFSPTIHPETTPKG